MRCKKYILIYFILMWIQLPQLSVKKAVEYLYDVTLVWIGNFLRHQNIWKKRELLNEEWRDPWLVSRNDRKTNTKGQDQNGRWREVNDVVEMDMGQPYCGDVR